MPHEQQFQKWPYHLFWRESKTISWWHKPYTQKPATKCMVTQRFLGSLANGYHCLPALAVRFNGFIILWLCCLAVFHSLYYGGCCYMGDPWLFGTKRRQQGEKRNGVPMCSVFLCYFSCLPSLLALSLSEALLTCVSITPTIYTFISISFESVNVIRQISISIHFFPRFLYLHLS